MNKGQEEQGGACFGGGHHKRGWVCVYRGRRESHVGGCAGGERRVSQEGQGVYGQGGEAESCGGCAGGERCVMALC